jgi:hypothetical protein
MGWLAGLRLNGSLVAASGPNRGELTMGDARRPWDTKPRPQGRPPLSYLIFRRALAGAIMVTSALMLVMFSLLLLSTWLPDDDVTVLYAPVSSADSSFFRAETPVAVAKRT